jgi:hypothetical protein
MINFKEFLTEAKKKVKNEETEIKNDRPSEFSKSEKSDEKEKEDNAKEKDADKETKKLDKEKEIKLAGKNPGEDDEKESKSNPFKTKEDSDEKDDGYESDEDDKKKDSKLNPFKPKDNSDDDK